jgi:hypothetical protein
MVTDELDVEAVQQDAAVIQELASRSGDLRAHDDPVVRALALWVEYVDAGVVDDTASFVMSGPDVGVARRTGRGRRGMLIAGSTALALVVSGGAAAAVTGDPLAVVKAPLQALAKANPFNDDDTTARDRLPEQTPTRAQANKLLADARRAMALGNTEKAERLLAKAQDLLGDDVSPGQQKFMDKLDGELPGRPGQAGGPAEGSQGGDKGNVPDQGGQPSDKGNVPDQGGQPSDKGNVPDQGGQPSDKGNVPDQGGQPSDKGSESARGGPSSKGVTPSDEPTQASG